MKRGGGSNQLPRKHVRIPVPRDGTPVASDLLRKKVTSSGQLTIQVNVSQTDERPYDWSAVFQLNNGGFRETDEEFPFLAPTTGYVGRVSVQMLKTDTNWAPSMAKRMYFVFGDPPAFGRMDVRLNARGEMVVLDYRINETGARELE